MRWDRARWDRALKGRPARAQVSVVAFVKGRLTVLATASDRHLGGRDFDDVIAEHFNEIWKVIAS